MVPMKHAGLWAIAMAILVIVGGAAAYFLAYEGTVTVSVKDAVGPWEHVWVTFSGVSIHESGKDNASWVTVSSTKQTVDLAALTSVSQLLGSAKLAPGHYEQIRLTVVNATGQQTGSGQVVTIAVPPDNATLKVAGQFTIASGKTTAITVDIRLGPSLREMNGAWEFMPVWGVDSTSPQ